MESDKNSEPTAKASRFPIMASIGVAIVAALIVIGVLTGFIPRIHRHEELIGKAVEPSMPVVEVVSSKPGKAASDLPLPAEIKPFIEAPIYARANGYLKHRLVDIGDQVRAGQLLAEIDAPELYQELERARGQLAQAEAALGLSRITAARWADLVKTASVSEQDNAEKQADFKLKQAITESARAEARRLEELVSFTKITAPFAGAITARNVDVGDLIVAGSSKELLRIAQTRKLRVFVQVPQSMARSIQIGQSVDMTLRELPGRVFKPIVVRSAGVMASDSRTLLVELEMDNRKDEVLAGSYAEARFTEAKMKPALTLPSNTVLFRPEGPQVGVVGHDGKVEMRTVKLGRDLGQSVEILGGITFNDRVIVNPSDSLSSGATVSVAKSVEKEKS